MPKLKLEDKMQFFLKSFQLFSLGLCMFSFLVFGQERTVSDYAGGITIDLSQVKDPFFDAKLVADKLAPQLFAISEPLIRIQTYGKIRASNDTLKKMMFTDLERSLVFSYLNSVLFKDKTSAEKSKAVYQLEKDGILAWTAMADIYYALIFDHLLESEDYQQKNQIDKLKYLDSLKDSCPWTVLTGFNKQIYWQMQSNKTADEIIQLKVDLEKEDINTFHYLK
ncbi:MAG: hypothetical protein PHV17_07895 [Candidatus Omnitrophica bacterium]|nr:hypothetical protein [Candidatus Omnitrophota bacterium]